tara:strand:- start:985 stop:1725 length:741 start_codon:yes stop_codon:yes gene_type:complete
MIKFFRKIRQRLLSENKFSKYLIYAIGEIVLVVIGILIAIQLNQWRNENANNQQKQKVLKVLQLEFQSNLSQLDTILKFNNKTQNAYPNAIKLISNKHVTKEIFNEAVEYLGFNWSFNPINGALRSSISSGEIHLINNDRLLELLFSWEDVVKDSEEEMQALRNYQMDTKPLFEKYIRLVDMWKPFYPGAIESKYPSDYTGIVNDVSFEDYVNNSYFNAQEYGFELNVIKNNNLEILKLIDQEVKK